MSEETNEINQATIDFLMDRLKNGTPKEKAAIKGVFEYTANGIQTAVSGFHAAKPKAVVIGAYTSDPKIVNSKKQYLEDLYETGSNIERVMVAWCLDKAAINFSNHTLSGSDLVITTSSDKIIIEYALEKAIPIEDAGNTFEQVLLMALDVVGTSVTKAFGTRSKELSVAVEKAELPVEVKPLLLKKIDQIFDDYAR